MLNVVAVSQYTAVKRRIYAEGGKQPMEVQTNKSEERVHNTGALKNTCSTAKYIERENRKLDAKREKRCHKPTIGRVEEKI